MPEHMPPWLIKRLPRVGETKEVDDMLAGLGLHTICDSGECPNKCECAPDGMAFLIMGDMCTRSCTFCSVNHTKPDPLDPNEPEHMAHVAKTLGLRYIFLTSVTRDDLEDGGASHYAKTIDCLRKAVEGIGVEVLIPDFKGDRAALETVLKAGPTVLGHNIETVPRLYHEMRPQADYEQSLRVLRMSKEIAPDILTKSGIMLGLGETSDEVVSTMKDIYDTGCDMLTLGQYLKPCQGAHEVVRYVTPEEFEDYLVTAHEIGFHGVASFPLMRSSYEAESFYKSTLESIRELEG